ncbi:Lrp/AsnC family transcriptional regulator [Xinfangfangia sp. CPCC 101601]|uniref:Lrp/AsnC family transcriptional regulator n=1 Tax=Pseudogemmobacter lacusdianii TaxID=3069608 RepID=A0ABU0VUP8_9RHOB|nr:Lrp/AsnC family transcriptional regulator [Xinfangfangia sp. CPCC 101601]MDQ2064990.1 Lrp/AsnC family transcriptional regulator [Xinfangfangia sp. CPCC 101601]
MQQNDETDLRLLAALQRDATLTAQDLGERLNLSPSQAARRRQRLEQTGVITGYRATVAPERVGLGVEAFIQVMMAAHSEANANDFRRMCDRREEIVGVWVMTGEADFMLRVWCADLAALSRLVQQALLPHPAVARVQSQIVMDRVKADAPLPVSAG